MKVIYHLDADAEVEAIARYYNGINPALVKRFRDELGECVTQIAANPMRFEQITRGIRRCIMASFPYGVFFRMPDADTVRIILVRHHSRHPGYGMRRR